MAEFRKINCVYHPEEVITNFCKERNCLMPLCPSCIGSHNDYHEKNGLRATYLNIFDSLTQAQTLIYDSLVNLEQDKKRNDEVIFNIHNLSGLVHEKIVTAKNIAYSALERAFEDLQKEILGTLDRKHDEVGIFSLPKCQRLQNQLVESIASLYQLTQNLKTDKCLSGMIRYYSDIQAQTSSLHSQMSHNLFLCENYNPCVEINEDAIQGYTNSIMRTVQIHFAFPNQPEIPVHSKFGTVSQMKRAPAQIVVHPPPGSRMLTPPKSRVVGPPVPALSSSVINRSRTPIRVDVSPAKVPSSIPKLSSNYEQEFENLSKKVRDMRKENEMLSKALKNF